MRLCIASTWNGLALERAQEAVLDIEAQTRGLVVDIDAPWAGDPPPPSAVGRCDGLWNYEVVELFLVASPQDYFELEVGPYGHYLALRLCGIRQRRADILLISDLQVSRTQNRWSARVVVPWEFVPQPVGGINAFLIAGQGDERRYAAHQPTGGEVPDFHRLERFRWLRAEECVELMPSI